MRIFSFVLACTVLVTSLATISAGRSIPLRHTSFERLDATLLEQPREISPRAADSLKLRRQGFRLARRDSDVSVIGFAARVFATPVSDIDVLGFSLVSVTSTASSSDSSAIASSVDQTISSSVRSKTQSSTTPLESGINTFTTSTKSVSSASLTRHGRPTVTAWTTVTHTSTATPRQTKNSASFYTITATATAVVTQVIAA